MLFQYKIRLRNLAASENFDTVTYNFCIINELTDLEKIIQHYLMYGAFLNLRRVNETTNQKLISVCKKYLSDQPQSIIKIDSDFNKVETSVEPNDSSPYEIEELSILNKIEDVFKSDQSVIVSNGIIKISEVELNLEETRIKSPNYSLYELVQMEGLSVRTINVCKRHELTDLEKILHFYYNEKERFNHLRNCGRKSEVELERLCKKYKGSNIKQKGGFSIKENCLIDVPYFELPDYRELSVRSQNVCSDNGFTNIRSIVSYYWVHGTFINLRKCGQKSNKELIDLSTKYEIYFLDENPKIEILIEEPPNPFIRKITNLSITQKSLLLNILNYRFSKLSVRSSNALKSFMESNISMQDVRFLLSNSESELRSIRNVGANTISEINDFINSLKELIETVSKYSDEDDIVVELFNSFLIQKFSLDQKILAEISADYDFSQGLPVFKTVHVLIENEILFHKKKKQIFKLGFNYYMDLDVLTLDQIAIKLELTRERIRQLRLKLLNGLSDSFSFLSEIEISTMNLYGIDLDCDYIIIKEDIINEINRIENTYFNIQFVLKILSVIIPDLFVLIGDEKSVLFNANVREAYNWQNTYLISKKYTDLFDFEKFIDDVSLRLSERIEEDFNFNFQTYLLAFQKDNCQNLLENISRIAEYILFNEFELCIDTNENIVFKRNTIKQVYEYSYHALEVLGKPSKVNVIYKKVIELFPDCESDENSIRASMRKDTGFVPIGRTSIYGLKKWEAEIDDFKGGTIRDIVEEYLHSETQPKHIDEITAFVNNYRNTTSKNIYANLNMDESKRFMFFRGLMIGLSSKKYTSGKCVKVIDLNIERKTWEERFSDLENFAEANNRLPKSISNNKERVLYRFMNIQLNKTTKNQINDDKASRINELVTKYKYHKRNRKISQDWNSNYTDLIKFVTANKRIPNARIVEEKLLYDFFYRQRKLYQEEKLTLEFVEKIIEIAKLLN